MPDTTAQPTPASNVPSQPVRSGRAMAPKQSRGARWPIYLFFLGLIVPIQIFAGPLRLTPYGIVLLCLIVPCTVVWLSGRAGRIHVVDVLVLLHALCVASALMAVHGASEIPFAGRYIIETFGAYLVARCFIRSADDFAAAARFHFVLIVILLPFAFFESVTGHNIIYTLLGSSTPGTIGDRWGLARAYGAFDHPILYGVFCASALASTFYILGRGHFTLKAGCRIGAVFSATFFSLSAGPLLALFLQCGLIAWDVVTRRIPYRWWILFGLFVAAYIVVDILSSRSPVRVFATYFTFSGHTAYDRIGDWTWGMVNIRQNPVFGIGLNDWVREPWMTSSLDAFWVVQAMRYGVPAFLLQASALFVLCFAVGRRRFRDRRLKAYRAAWLVTIVALIISGVSVHFWNALYCLVMFLQGSGVWLLTVKERRPVRLVFPATQGAHPLSSLQARQ
jgi:hypothetical protein